MRYLFLAVPLLLTGCTDLELSSHLWKKTVNDPAPYQAPSIKVKRKIGKPYRINGVTYYPLQSSEGYRRKGIASWYGSDFHGKKTANGEIYNMYAMTAAHPTLPLPTWVRVTNLENGRNILVRVNDRGPFLRGRLIDLSYTAASKLGMAEQGTAPVLVEALPSDGSIMRASGKPAPDYRVAAKRNLAPEVETAKEKKGFTHRVSAEDPAQAEIDIVDKPVVQVQNPKVSTESLKPNTKKLAGVDVFVQTGAFGEVNNAKRQLASVSRYYNAARMMEVVRDGRTLHRVRVGPLETIAEADTVLAKLVDAGFNTAIIVVD